MGEAVVSDKNNPQSAYKLANNQCPFMVRVTAYIPSSCSYILPSSCLFLGAWWIKGNPPCEFSLFIILSLPPHLIRNGSATFAAYKYPTDPKVDFTLVLLTWRIGELQFLSTLVHASGSLELHCDLFPDTVKWQLNVHPCSKCLKSEGSNSLK